MEGVEEVEEVKVEVDGDRGLISFVIILELPALPGLFDSLATADRGCMVVGPRRCANGVMARASEVKKSDGEREFPFSVFFQNRLRKCKSRQKFSLPIRQGFLRGEVAFIRDGGAESWLAFSPGLGSLLSRRSRLLIVSTALK
jgi:hypothetical protein